VRSQVVTLLVVALLIGGVLALAHSDDDEPVDPRAAGAQRAIAVALEVVPGRVTGIARDRDNGKWEVTVRQDGRDFEVELRPDDLALLRVDYDTSRMR
jgi:uncharacterized membrane protein YkoI